MNKILKLSIISLLCLLMTAPVFIFKVNAADDTLKATNIRVEIEVSEYNVLTITEIIDIDFLTPHHGIIRSIPLENSIEREDGATDYNHATIYDVNCNFSYTTDYSYSTYTIKIGDPDKTVEGPVQYVLTYKYDLGKDPLKDADELYLNIIGNEWTYDIEHLQVVIHMPKEFDSSKVGASHGEAGTVDSSGIQQRITGNIIEFRYDDVLMAGEAFTVRCELPEGYFREEFSLSRLLSGVLGIAVAIILGVINKLIYNRFGKPDPVLETVEYYPPENMSPPRLYNILYNKVSDRSVNGLLISLASKGYLTIETYEDGNYKFTLYDKSAEELNDEEKIYYYGLKTKAIKGEDGTAIITRELVENSFYDTVWTVKAHIRDTAERVYEKGQNIYAVLNIICGLVLILLVPLKIVLEEAIWNFKWYHWAAVGLCLITGLYLVILGFRYRKRTKRNNELYGRALGFRQFLDMADKERLEMLEEENPMYFYDILPYAYALGLTGEWMKNFEGMLHNPADWYHGDDFEYFMSSGMDDYSRYASRSRSAGNGSDDSDDSYDSSDGWSSSSDSGGGSSGGGSGGGGSSGW